MDAQRGLSVSGHRNTVLCLHLTSDTYHVTPSGRAPRARGKFWIRRVKLRIFRPDPKSHKSEGFPAAQIFKTHKCQNTYCRSAHFSKAVKFVGAQNPRGTPCTSNSLPRAAAARLRRAPRFLRKQTRRVGLCKFTDRVKDRSQLLLPAPTILTRHEAHPFRTHRVRHEVRGRRV